MDSNTHTLWVLANILGAVVVVAVAALLTILVLLVRVIDKRVAQIRATLTAAKANTANTELINQTAAAVDAVLAEGLEHNRNTPTLTAQANWPTPRTKGMCGGSGAWEQLKANTTIEEARSMGAGNGGKLNPMWVEWLMGWPLGWTDLKPLEMDKSHSVQQQHGNYLVKENNEQLI